MTEGGDLQSPVDYLVVVGADAGSPKLLLRFPLEDRPGSCSTPTEIVPFCLPFGCSVRPDCPLPKAFSFVVTGSEGDKLYATGLHYYVTCPAPESEGAASDGDTPAEKSEASSLTTKSSSHSPKCICLLSRHPFFSSMHAFLRQIYRVSQSPEHVPLERYVAMLVLQTPQPMPGFMAADVSVGGEQITFALPGHAHFPLADFSYLPLFHCCNLKTVLAVLRLLLAEQSLVVHSSHVSLLCPVCEGLLSLMFPLEHSTIYVPVLPPLYPIEILESPTPFVMGVLSDRVKSDIGNISCADTLFFLDLDTGRLTRGTGEYETATVTLETTKLMVNGDPANGIPGEKLPLLPKAATDFLVKTVGKFLDSVYLGDPNEGRRQDTLEWSDFAFQMAPLMDEASRELLHTPFKVRLPFFCAILYILRTHQSCIRFSGTSSDIDDIVDKDQLIKSCSSDVRPIMTIFSKTQMFAVFTRKMAFPEEVSSYGPTLYLYGVETLEKSKHKLAPMLQSMQRQLAGRPLHMPTLYSARQNEPHLLSGEEGHHSGDGELTLDGALLAHLESDIKQQRQKKDTSSSSSSSYSEGSGASRAPQLERQRTRTLSVSATEWHGSLDVEGLCRLQQDQLSSIQLSSILIDQPPPGKGLAGQASKNWALLCVQDVYVCWFRCFSSYVYNRFGIALVAFVAHAGSAMKKEIASVVEDGLSILPAIPYVQSGSHDADVSHDQKNRDFCFRLVLEMCGRFALTDVADKALRLAEQESVLLSELTMSSYARAFSQRPIDRNALIEGWEERVDRRTGQNFWFDSFTQTTHWQPPCLLPPDWEMRRETTGRNRIFYRNSVTEKTQFEPPPPPSVPNGWQIRRRKEYPHAIYYVNSITSEVQSKLPMHPVTTSGCDGAGTSGGQEETATAPAHHTSHTLERIASVQQVHNVRRGLDDGDSPLSGSGPAGWLLKSQQRCPSCKYSMTAGDLLQSWWNDDYEPDVTCVGCKRSFTPKLSVSAFSLSSEAGGVGSSEVEPPSSSDTGPTSEGTSQPHPSSAHSKHHCVYLQPAVLRQHTASVSDYHGRAILQAALLHVNYPTLLTNLQWWFRSLDLPLHHMLLHPVHHLKKQPHASLSAGSQPTADDCGTRLITLVKENVQQKLGVIFEHSKSGMYVKEVKQGSLADQAGGLVEGQVIAALNNRIAMGLHGSDVVQIWTSNTTVSFMVTDAIDLADHPSIVADTLRWVTANYSRHMNVGDVPSIRAVSTLDEEARFVPAHIREVYDVMVDLTLPNEDLRMWYAVTLFLMKRRVFYCQLERGEISYMPPSKADLKVNSHTGLPQANCVYELSMYETLSRIAEISGAVKTREHFIGLYQRQLQRLAAFVTAVTHANTTPRRGAAPSPPLLPQGNFMIEAEQLKGLASLQQMVLLRDYCPLASRLSIDALGLGWRLYD